MRKYKVVYEADKVLLEELVFGGSIITILKNSQEFAKKQGWKLKRVKEVHKG